MSRSLPAAPHRAARPPALGSRSDSDDLPSPPLAASIRQNTPFPASPPAHPGEHWHNEHWHNITDQSPIRPSSTTAATTPLSSPALSSRRSSRNYPRLQPLRRQIAIIGQALTAFPRVPSSEGDIAEAWHHGGEIVSAVEAVLEFGELAGYMFVVGWRGKRQ